MSAIKPEDISVIVVEDEVVIAQDICIQLVRFGYKTAVFPDAERVLNHFASSKDAPSQVVIMDIHLRGKVDGIDAAKIIMAQYAHPVIFLSGNERSDYYERALAVKPFAYLCKPVRHEHLRMSVDAAARFLNGVATIRGEIADGDKEGVERRLVGISNAMAKMRKDIAIIGPSNLPVVIMGETGTGKEVVFMELLRASVRRGIPYSAINCAALGSLADSELFGHVRGAFTGAQQSTTGHIGLADKGTLFLDEIEALSLEVQAKLLRFLDSGEYNKVGEAQSRKADVRVISASNADLEVLCKEGKFRNDLFYRLAGSILRTTPLRDCREDIPPLVSHFLASNNMEKHRNCLIADEAMSVFQSYNWPGNVRQLKQVINLLCERHPGGIVKADDLKDLLCGGLLRGDGRVMIYQEAKGQSIEEFDKRYFPEILSLSKGKLKTAIELTGMHKKNFYMKLKSLGLSLHDFK